MKLGYLIFLSFIVIYLHAQQPVFRNIGLKDGIGNSAVYDILQDSKGYIWIASEGGIKRFNGRTFTSFFRPNGIPHDIMYTLAEDTKGRVFASGAEKGIWYYNGTGIDSIAANDSLILYLQKAKAIITKVTFDEADTLWVATSRTLLKIPPDQNYKKLIYDSSFSDSAVCVMKFLKNGKVIESQYHNSIKKFSVGNASITCWAQAQNIFDIKANSSLLKIDFDKAKSAIPKFFALKTHNGKLLYSYLNTLYINEKGKLVAKKDLPARITRIYEDSENNLWISLSSTGLYFYENGDLEKTPDIFLEGKTVTSVLEDNEHGFWCCTNDKGIFYTPTLNFYQYNQYPDLCDNVRTLAIIDSALIAVTAKTDLYMIQPNNQINKIPSIVGLKTSNTFGFQKVGNTLLACGAQVSEVNLENLNIKYHKNERGLPIYGIASTQLPNGELLGLNRGALFTIKNGIWKYRNRTPGRDISMKYHKQSNTLWLGTLIGLYTLQDTTFIPCENKILANARVYSMREDEKGRLYICTANNGLFILENKKWINISTNDGLLTNTCIDVFCDKNDMLWIATKGGISFMKFGNLKSIQLLGLNDGLPSDEVRELVGFENKLWVACLGSMYLINTDKITTNKMPPRIYFSKIVVNDQVMKSEIHNFDHHQKKFRFYIDCLTYKELFKQQYKYILKGFSDSASLSANDFIEFSSLSSGSYTLEVYGLTTQGVTSTQPLTFAFRIEPPLWKKIWFIIIEIVLGASLVFFYIKWRINKVRIEEDEKSRLQNDIINARINALQAQMNPHFIFNSINSIQSFILQNETQKAYDYLAKFARLVRGVLNNSQETFVTLEKELENIKLYVEIERMRFKNNFDFVIEINGVDIEEVKLPAMIIQPHIENSIWHGILPLDKSKDGYIKLCIDYKDGYLEINIIDNGVGRKSATETKKSEIHRSYGTKLVEEKIEMIGRIYGKKVSYEVIDLLDDNLRSTGTKVTIKLPVSKD